MGIVPFQLTCDRALLLTLTRFFSHHVGTACLYSGGSFDSARFSFLCLFPFEFLMIQGNQQWHSYRNPYENLTYSPQPWETLKLSLSTFNSIESYPDWVGFIGYGMGACSDKEKRLPYFPSSTPDLYLQRSALTLIVDHQTEKVTLVKNPSATAWLSSENRQWVNQLSSEEGWLELFPMLAEPIHQVMSPMTLNSRSDSLESYTHKIAYAQEKIRAGEIYQVNLSQQFRFKGRQDPFRLFEKLVARNPAPFSAYLNFPGGYLVSSSPERLLKKEGLLLETRPIKGTVPRGKTSEEDQRQRQALLSSEKNRAELLMITDLMRNDLSRISIPGSVQVKELWRCEAYTNVYHLLSIVQSQTRKNVSPIDLLRTCFPGGSITGCPKLRAMEVIAELEQRPRGIYTGSIGYFAGNGDFDFNIAIRTLLFQGETLDLQLGGAIVSDSDPESEYAETLHKGISIFEAIGYEENQTENKDGFFCIGGSGRIFSSNEFCSSRCDKSS